MSLTSTSPDTPQTNAPNHEEAEDSIQVRSTNPVAEVDKQAHVESQLQPPNDVNADVYDWADFQARFNQAYIKADKLENEIIAEFASYSHAFSIWAQMGSVRDNVRAAKRIKTRNTYVHGSELELKNKTQHYEDVVKAFEAAMALLNNA